MARKDYTKLMDGRYYWRSSDLCLSGAFLATGTTLAMCEEIMRAQIRLNVEF
jgi:hypothetical protein